METPLPSTDSHKSLNVEESRAKRLERQQARLRDRGGIFRPANRNNNLFDILCKATHRQSPARARGLSRSRSVSPRKKLVAPSASEKLMATGQVGRTTEPDTPATVKLPKENSTLGKKSKGRLKQDDAAVGTGDPDGEKPKRKPRARKAASTTKKTTKASQRTKGVAKNDLPEDVDMGDQKQTRPKGKRKKQNLEDDVATEGAQPKPTRTKIAKSNTTVQSAHDLVGGTDQQSPKAKRKQSDEANGSQRPEPKMSSEKPLTDHALDDPAVQPTKTKSKKRKAADLDVEDEPRSRKRKAPSKSRPKPKESTTKTDARVASRKKPALVSLGMDNTSQAIADAINDASGRPLFDHDYQKTVEPARTLRDSRNVTGPEGVPGPLKPKVDPMPSIEKSLKPASKRGKKTKPIEDEQDQQKPQAPKTASRKRKENSVATKLSSGAPAPKGEKRPNGPLGIPGHIKQKLKARHDNYTSDDEPDPIDFLS